MSLQSEVHKADRTIPASGGVPEQTLDKGRLAATHERIYSSGCNELDKVVFGTQTRGSLAGGVVGISAEGDVGLALSLQIAARYLRGSPPATARIVTTHPVTHILRLLKDVVGKKEDKKQRAELLRRVLISRIYSSDDLLAVIDELEEAQPFSRLWSATVTATDDGRSVSGSAPDVAVGGSHEDQAPRNQPSQIMIITEMDHHFKWMRLQGQGLRLHELYGQLMRRLRALATARLSSSIADIAATNNRPLVLVLNNTVLRRDSDGPQGPDQSHGGTRRDERGHSANSDKRDADSNYRLALSLLQSPLLPQSKKADVLRFCCHELAKTRNIEPRYRSLMDYLCSLHICLTSIPLDDVAPIVHGSSWGVAHPESLWAVSVEHDEGAISQPLDSRIGVVQFMNGTVQDILSP